jgi:hypothetical protein
MLVNANIAWFGAVLANLDKIVDLLQQNIYFLLFLGQNNL